MAILNCSIVLGQTSFTANVVNSPSGSTTSQGVNQTTSIALDTVQHRLFVADDVNNRVLVFQLDNNNRVPGTMPILPIHVLGAANFNVVGSGATTSQTFRFCNLCYDNANARLFLSDSGLRRVLCFDCRPGNLTDFAAAVFVIGQTDFTHNGSATTQTGLAGPDDIDYDAVNGRLFVSDSGNNRVMCFPVANGVYDSSASNPAASFVLGQSSFTAKVAGNGQAGMTSPFGIAYDPVNARVFVSDSANNRILCFSAPPGSGSGINGENATFVLGQADFTHYAGSTYTQNGLNGPDDLNYDSTANRLWACDSSNVRIVEFIVPNSATSSFNGANASQNLNAADWVSSNAGTSQSAFTGLEPGHAFDPVNNVLYGYESFKYRVVEFDLINITTASVASAVVGQVYSQALQIAKTQGTSQNFSIASGSLPAGLTLNASTGTISGTPTTAGSSTFTVQANDVFATGSFFHQHSFSIVTAGATLLGGNLPLIERIRQNILQVVGDISVEQGYQCNCYSTEPDRLGEVGTDGITVVADVQLGGAQWNRELQCNNIQCWIQEFEIIATCAQPEPGPSGSPPIPADQLVLIVRADIEKALQLDPHRGGLAANTLPAPPSWFEREAGEHEGVITRVYVEYRTNWNDPYSFRA
ncbi:MAG TPA: putative Ig domain-containing protein [Tepidisphaeraceae bacterium]|jgi:DNA-binding beta-propeller fold protein YncE|nr:putative Ig domain-containing protein [Tepidisphaeraceae bacterium]